MDFIKKIITVFVLVASFFASACNNESTSINAGQDSLMLINASPDAGAIDFTFNDVKINSQPLSYTQNTAYTLIDVGIKKVETTIPPSTVKQLSIPILLQPKKVYSVFFAGTLKNNLIEYVATQDNLSNPDKGKSKYRFINLSPNSSTLDLRLASDSVLVSNLPYRSASDFNQIKAGAYSFKLISRDTAIKTNATLNFTLLNGKVYTFWAKGLVKGEGTQAVGIQVIQNK
jgi:predicted small secreted protein